MPYTYVVQCADGSYYTGWTTALEARVRAHNEGRGARYTRSRRPVQLVYWEFQPTRSAAQRREAALRRLSRDQKAALAATFAQSHDKRMTREKHDAGHANLT
jgi:putative endonuclease